MKDTELIDLLLKQVLSPKIEPSEALNQIIINQLKNKGKLKAVYKKRLALTFIVVVLILIMSITAFAVWQLLTPEQVADHFDDRPLAHAFEGENAIEINKSVISSGYNFTLLGIVSGEGLSSIQSSVQDVHPDRTYAVVSIAKQDGGLMPSIQDEGYGKIRFFISPLVKGQRPWQVNIASMNGGYRECVIDGIMYRLIECDGVEIFADRGLYLCINTGSLYDTEAFNYDDKTGEIRINSDYKGINVLFDLPLDLKKADYDKAERYLEELLESEVGSTANEETSTDIRKELENGVVIPESIKEVTYDKNGMACYEYEGSKVVFSVKHQFKEGEIGVWKDSAVFGSDERRVLIQFKKDADGVITGRALKLN